MMKRIFFTAIIALMAMACGQSGQSSSQTTGAEMVDEAKVTVYYFHGRMRCQTCLNIQSVVNSAVEENFADNDEVTFVEIDFSDRANAALADKYEIAFSSVVIATANAHTNLTDEAFAMVMNNPDGLRQLVVDETNKYLNN